MIKSKTICITGGHLSPALATIEELIKQDWKIIYIGQKFQSRSNHTQSDEYQTITQLQIPFYSISTGRWHRHSKRAALQSMFLVPLGFVQAFHILSKQRPDIVLSFGSYLSVPVIIAAHILQIPIVIHEQTRVVGIANQIGAKLATKIAISFPDSAQYFPPHKTILTGNPVRKDTITSSKSSDFLSKLPARRPTIYITGGHQGSDNINQTIFKILPELNKEYNIIHSIGLHAGQDELFQKIQKLHSQLSYPNAYLPARFFTPDQIGAVYHQSQLVISRAGANTCTELVHLQKPCLLIPLTTGQKDEQLKNAELLQKLGLADILPESKLTPKYLMHNIQTMIKQLDQYTLDLTQSRKLFPIDAPQRLVSIINTLCN